MAESSRFARWGDDTYGSYYLCDGEWLATMPPKPYLKKEWEWLVVAQQTFPASRHKTRDEAARAWLNHMTFATENYPRRSELSRKARIHNLRNGTDTDLSLRV